MKLYVQDLGMVFDDGSKKIELFEGLSLEVQKSNSLAIIGESGVGKTTLLYLLSSLERPTSGTVKINNFEVSVHDPSSEELAKFRRENIGFVFQFHYLLPEFTALENVVIPLKIAGVEQAEAVEKAESLLEKVGLKDRLTHKPGELSGGEQQRVAIARAFANNPGIVFADEPTGNLDQRTGAHVTELLLELQEKHGITLVVVTHSLDLAGRMQKTLELRNGELLEMSL